MGLDTVAPQPKPVPGRESVTDAVISDLTIRREGGIKKYGMQLQTHNGRSYLVDAYQELLDAALYVRGALMEDEDREMAVGHIVNAQQKLKLLLPQVKDKWVVGDILATLELAVKRLTPPEPAPGAALPSSPSSPSAS